MVLIPIRSYEIEKEHIDRSVQLSVTIPISWIRKHCMPGDMLVLYEHDDNAELSLKRVRREKSNGESIPDGVSVQE